MTIISEINKQIQYDYLAIFSLQHIVSIFAAQNYKKHRKVIFMRKLTLEDYQEIKSWVYRNARQIELSIWRYHFENGSKEDVLTSLSFY